MEINKYPRAKQNRLYKTASSEYESSYEKARFSKSLVREEKSAQLNNDGKVIKGEIIDLRFQEVKIRLEPTGQVITAKIDGEVPLFIGQTAEFLISDKAEEQITLRYISTDNTPMHDIVHKALYASGLAISERNKSIVQELLNFQMPVDKNTILYLIKLSATYPDVGIRTLILMLKNQLTINPVNVAQFESYQKGMHRILTELNILKENIGTYLEDITSDIYNEFTMNTEISGDKSHISNTDNTKNNINTGIKEQSYTKDIEEKIITNDFDKSEDIMLIYKELLSILREGETAGHHYSPDTPIKYYLSDNELIKLHDTIRNILGDSDSNMVNYVNNLLTDNLVTLRELLNLFYNLYDKNQAWSLSDNIVLPAQLFEAFIGISDSLSGTDKEKLIYLLKENNYHKQITKAFHNRWTLSPKNLKEEIMERKFFRRLYEDLEKLKELTDTKLPESPNVKVSIEKLQDNLQFMRELNELFFYLQLPMRLTNQDVHGDLYVFTRKNKAYNTEQINVLLHLDMTNLGRVDIHMTMKNRLVNAIFYLEETSEQLMSRHLHELTDILQKKGYQFQVSTKVSSNKPDFITDILQGDTLDRTVSRYSFDIRA